MTLQCQVNPLRSSWGLNDYYDSGSKMCSDFWCLSYAEKPSEDYEDPKDVEAICEAKENIGDYIGVKHRRVNAEMKREELISLEENVQTHTNTQMFTSALNILCAIYFTPMCRHIIMVLKCHY